MNQEGSEGMNVSIDVYNSVAQKMVKLRKLCIICNTVNSDRSYPIGYGNCTSCGGIGWTPTYDFKTIIQSIDYPFTLILRNDMMGWMAELIIYGQDTECNEDYLYDSPLDAVYAALYRSLSIIDQYSPTAPKRNHNKKIRQVAVQGELV
jgi:hypothetical protein